MALKYEKPNPALTRELAYVARDAADLLRALCDANYLPEPFPLDEITDILKTLEALPHGTAEGCRVPLDHGRLRLAEIGQRYIEPEDEDGDKKTNDAPPALTRGMAIDQAFGKLILQISYAQAQYREQAGEGDGEDHEAERIVRPGASVRLDLDAVRDEAIDVEKSYHELGNDLEKQTNSVSERADQLIRQTHDVEGHARLAKNEVQKSEIRPSRLKKITAALRHLPKAIETTGKAVVTTVDVAEPFVKQWSEFWDNVLDLQIKNLRKLGENLQRAGRRLQNGSGPRALLLPEMVLIPEGTFLMGSPETETARRENEHQHEVTISKPFGLGMYPVTFDEYDYFCDQTGREKPDDEGWGRDDRPVIHVSHYDALAYCSWLSEATGRQYHLPSEAQWEYACRAGTTTAYAVGDQITYREANFDARIKGQTSVVGSYQANAWGLRDMHGNVWEWCADWFGDYPLKSVTDPQGPEIGKDRVVRGGSWHDYARIVRSAFRDRHEPGISSSSLGFRCAEIQEQS